MNELLSANENQHEAAKYFLKQISKQTGTKFPSMFFETDRGINRYNFQRAEGETQIPLSKSDLLNENLPISKILQLQDKIFSEIHTHKIQKEQIRYLYMLRNAIDTLVLLCSERVFPYKFVDDREFTLTEDFKKIINLFETIITENDKIYKPYVYIIMEEEKKKHLKRLAFQEQNMLKARFKKEDLEKKLQNLGKNQKFYLFLYF